MQKDGGGAECHSHIANFGKHNSKYIFSFLPLHFHFFRTNSAAVSHIFRPRITINSRIQKSYTSKDSKRQNENPGFERFPVHGSGPNINKTERWVNTFISVFIRFLLGFAVRFQNERFGHFGPGLLFIRRSALASEADLY